MDGSAEGLFGAGPARHRQDAPAPAPEVTPAAEDTPPSRPQPRWAWSGAPDGQVTARPDATPSGGWAHEAGMALAAAMPQSSLSVRPYFFTRGRTRSSVELQIETLVSVVPGAMRPSGAALVAFEHCRETRSVAEVAALMGVPLGVARVLLGDLAEAGAVVVHQTVPAEGPALALMERVLIGLRNL